MERILGLKKRSMVHSVPASLPSAWSIVRIPCALRGPCTKSAFALSLGRLFWPSFSSPSRAISPRLTAMHSAALQHWLTDHLSHSPEPADLCTQTDLSPSAFAAASAAALAVARERGFVMNACGWPRISYSRPAAEEIAAACGYESVPSFTRLFSPPITDTVQGSGGYRQIAHQRPILTFTSKVTAHEVFRRAVALTCRCTRLIFGSGSPSSKLTREEPRHARYWMNIVTLREDPSDAWKSSRTCLLLRAKPPRFMEQSGGRHCIWAWAPYCSASSIKFAPLSAKLFPALHTGHDDADHARVGRGRHRVAGQAFKQPASC